MRDHMANKSRCYVFTGLFILGMVFYLTWSIIIEQNTLQVRLKELQKNEISKIIEAQTQHNTPVEVKAEQGAKPTIKQYDLRIIAMVFDRSQSLLRLLRSINAAEYFNDDIKLEVWIDRAINGSFCKTVHKAAKDFKFQHGDYSVHVHPTHVGIHGQWLDTWKPVENSSEIALLLEDDIQVSPLFYRYLKAVHKKYDAYPNINGFALQGFSVLLSSGGGDLKTSYQHPVFLYPSIGCWGFSPSTKNWIKFLEWVKPTMQAGSITPHVPGTVASNWYRTHKGTMWEMWHIYYSWNHNETTLYVNLEGHEGFTANWRELGLHFKPWSKGIGTPSNPLVTTWKPAFDDLPDDPVELNFRATIINH